MFTASVSNISISQEQVFFASHDVKNALLTHTKKIKNT